jgi:hypothetical protein
MSTQLEIYIIKAMREHQDAKQKELAAAAATTHEAAQKLKVAKDIAAKALASVDALAALHAESKDKEHKLLDEVKEAKRRRREYWVVHGGREPSAPTEPIQTEAQLNEERLMIDDAEPTPKPI